MSAELDYELVVSRRAKRATLRVLPGRRLVVSIPQRFPKSCVPDFVQHNRSWIESAFTEQAKNTPLHYQQWPPRQLCLPALGKVLQVDYAGETDTELTCVQELNERGSQRQQGASEASSDNLQVPPSSLNVQLTVFACPNDRQAVAREIAMTLKSLARDFLPPLLASYAHLHDLHYQRVSIRGQRTRWGSFSSTGTLSLNYKLLFLSRELMTYVLLHELAHTRYLDHSEAFWQLLSQLDVNARKLDKQLRAAGSAVPPWLELVR